ncbi:MAG: hypothetical protein AAGB12_04660 [Pseudomonadota bacterium]
MFAKLFSFHKPDKMASIADTKINRLGQALMDNLDCIRSLHSSRFFENIISGRDSDDSESEQQVSCYIGNFRLIFGFYGSLTTIDWSTWNDDEDFYHEIAFMQRVDPKSEWHVVSHFLDDELLDKHAQLSRLLQAMQTYEDFMYRRQMDVDDSNSMRKKSAHA